MTKNAIISTRLLTLIAAGMDPAEALDTVCGVGSYAGLVDSLYDELRAQAEQAAGAR